MQGLTEVLGDTHSIAPSLSNSLVDLSALYPKPDAGDGPAPISQAVWVSLVIFLMQAWPDKAIQLVPSLYLGHNKTNDFPVGPEVMALLEEGVERFYPKGVVIERCKEEQEPKFPSAVHSVSRVDPSLCLSAKGLINTRVVWKILTGEPDDPITLAQCSWPDSQPMHILVGSLNEIVWKPLKAMKAFQMAMTTIPPEQVTIGRYFKKKAWTKKPSKLRIFRF